MNFEQIKLFLYQQEKLPLPGVRRELLIEKMGQLAQQGFDCQKCSGSCCSFENNSMQIDLLQAIDIIDDLKQKNLLTKTLLDKINNSIVQYRLDYNISTKANSLLRKRYTCPFYTHNICGCLLGLEYKPYGCLAFNPNSANQCHSDYQTQCIRDNLFASAEAFANQKLETILKFHFPKKTIPEVVWFVLTKLNGLC
ncbi:MAG: hypothetical protein A2504_02620 [Bdellovibrionales bacterium RIFOXYD12_FULL_39_22]|nr:MAG: hypothetical protein A2385_12650 [Bdellovibrionales bacterium RIFOXYB1_FULL_39_21]OFZ41198.1 MAG: hypothetical protein A2485_01060 [Bdellovibrionales bacterium RIFOXYC12_FULL_39_17]OFZ44952.1 MAG: hypothetical protein A2404_11805 [Bdellovibrionales bacterium RIFOXYC1_FULL_39_130]OFZ74399.1 MAG: hypothetical protein A2560_12175 [Bdellovibrionales bacterium RIFOXYD1_FULL_39_84]OFZ74721.1 MAG: hypothetical protein A2451_09930 [Bdellovibrionales bacterium RIFOXYC2_FULL_39_8]OFZ92401.1 MAG: